MGETLSLFRSSFNKSLRIESRPERLTGEPGAVLLREIMERARIIEWLTERLRDPRNADRVPYPLADLARTVLLFLGQGWRDQDGAEALRNDAGLRLAASGSRGATPLLTEAHPASQPTLSRLIALLSMPANRTVLHEAITELAGADDLPGGVVVEGAPGGPGGVGAARAISGRSLLADHQP